MGPIRLLPLLTNAAQQPGRPPLFRPLDIAASGLSAQRLRMETIATNVANAETTSTPEGGPYRRRVVRMEPTTREGAAVPPFLPLPSEQLRRDQAMAPVDPTESLGGVQATGIEEDPSEGPLVYDPGHPDADARGYVRYPNVRVTDEMVDLMEARRLYEANSTVFQAARQLLRRALDI
jgi:flagellar basal-body rod protein FlgC